MGRPKRIDLGGYVYHVLNRGNGRMAIFDDAGDYDAFEQILQEAVEREPGVGVLAYCLMPRKKKVSGTVFPGICQINGT